VWFQRTHPISLGSEPEAPPAPNRCPFYPPSSVIPITPKCPVVYTKGVVRYTKRATCWVERRNRAPVALLAIPGILHAVPYRPTGKPRSAQPEPPPLVGPFGVQRELSSVYAGVSFPRFNRSPQPEQLMMFCP
jgi:hypothetical protein